MAKIAIVQTGQTVEIIGIAKDDTKVESVTVNGKDINLQEEKIAIVEKLNAVRFTARVNISECNNAISVVARDSAGNQTNESFTLKKDTKPPVVEIISPAVEDKSKEKIVIVQAGSPVKIIGIAKDDTKVANVTINGQNAKLTEQQDRIEVLGTKHSVRFTATVKLPKGEQILKIRAVDTSGNVTSVNVRVKEPIGKRYALLVGVGDYDNPSINDLPACVNDVEDLATMLQEANRGGFEVMKLVSNKTPQKDDDPTGTSVLRSLKAIVNQAKPEDLLLFYFSGHGYYLKNTEESYLLTEEADVDFLNRTALSSRDLNSILDTAKAKKIITIFDSCHAGGVTLAKATDAESLPKSYYEAFVSSEGCWTLYSCKENEWSYLLDDRQNSVFSKYLIDGLKGEANKDGDEFISMSELYDYVHQKVVAHFSNDSTRQQTPMSDSRIVGKIPLVADLRWRLKAQIDRLYSLLEVHDIPAAKRAERVLRKRHTQPEQLEDKEKKLLNYIDTLLKGDIDVETYLQRGDKKYGQ